MLFRSDVNRRGTTVIMATHESQYVNFMRRRVITMEHGRVLQDAEKGRYGDVPGWEQKVLLLPKLRTDLI